MRNAFLALTAAALAAGCGPTRMDATEAARVLEHFATGSREAVDVCAADGRNTLRGAVRAYSAAMAQGGQTWPNLRAPDEASEMPTAVELSVLISYAAGFVRSSDLQSRARGQAQRMALANLPHLIEFRGVAMTACAEVVAVQRAAAAYLREMQDYRVLVESAERRGGREAVDRIRRQSQRVEDRRADMEAAARVVQARIDG